MDKSIEQEVNSGKRRKFLIGAFVVLALIGGITWLLRISLRSSVQRSSITTAVVEKGNIENTLNASGEILPEFEQIITSPINASIQKVVLDAGAHVIPGQSILTLDKSASQAEYEKMKFQLETRRNDIRKLKLELDKSFYDLQSNNDIKQLRINSLMADLENAKRLYKAGGGTRESVEQAELNLKVAQLEKKQLENEIRSKQQTMQVEMRESEIAAQIQENDLKELDRKLRQADIAVGREGVVTWVNKNLGASVKEGETLARIADLSSFKATGNISDTYQDQLHSGMKVVVRINETLVTGMVTNIHPAIQNATVSFDIQLDERNNKLFRPNMKVDVFLVTSSHENIMRVANGPAFRGANEQDIFVVRQGKAERRTVHIGLSNFDFVEILDNVRPGDVIITSDMSTFRNSREITLVN